MMFSKLVINIRTVKHSTKAIYTFMEDCLTINWHADKCIIWWSLILLLQYLLPVLYSNFIYTGIWLSLSHLNQTFKGLHDGSKKKFHFVPNQTEPQYIWLSFSFASWTGCIHGLNNIFCNTPYLKVVM